jgi:hypothetical protein
MRIKEQDLKLNMRKNEFERVNAVQMKMDLMKHKEKIEGIYR